MTHFSSQETRARVRSRSASHRLTLQSVPHVRDPFSLPSTRYVLPHISQLCILGHTWCDDLADPLLLVEQAVPSGREQRPTSEREVRRAQRGLCGAWK